MAGHAPLVQTEIDALTAKFQIYKYLVAIGPASGGSMTILGPLKSAPKVEPDTETKEVKLYETGAEPQAEYLTKDNLKLTLELEDVDTAAALYTNITVGTNLLDSSRAQCIILQPITDDVGAKTFTFPNAYLRPGFTPTFEDEDDPNYATLEYLCKPVNQVDSGGVVTRQAPFTHTVTSGGVTIVTSGGAAVNAEE